MIRFTIVAVTGAVLVAVWLVPAFVARYRGHRSALAITMLTVLLGWSVIGWIIAMVWACTGDDRPEGRVQRAADREALREQVEIEAAARRLARDRGRTID